MTDHELAKGCREGRREAQQMLWKLHSRRMMAVCLRYCDSREEAEDVMQDGFVKVFEKINQWQGSGPLGGWIRTVIINTALTHIRSRQKWKNSVDLDHAEELDSEEADALSVMNEAQLLELIEKMPSGYKAVFNLFAIEGFGHKEIGDMLGISENTSKTQFLKAKSWLRKNLTEQNYKSEYIRQ